MEKEDIFGTKTGVKKAYISDVVDIRDAKPGVLNLIASGCGTGKSYFIMHSLLEKLPDVKPEDVVFVTSRAITVAQQSNEDGVVKYDHNDPNTLNYWNGDDRTDYSRLPEGISIMTYDKIIRILLNQNCPGKELLNRVKIVVLDECHTMVSDTFISNMSNLWTWTRCMLQFQCKLFIGITATPGIVLASRARLGIEINQLNQEALTPYQAKQMICVSRKYVLPVLERIRATGKTLIMCSAVSDCFDLQAVIPNSAVMVSKHNKYYTPEMGQIIDYIARNEELPPTYEVPSAVELARRRNGKEPKFGSGVTHPLDTLITTTTAREGYNLRESSGVRNVVSYYSDDLHLTQICGRARYDLDNIVVVHKILGEDRTKRIPYLAEQRALFGAYMKDPTDDRWFQTVKHLVKHDFSGVLREGGCRDVEAFRRYMEGKWLIPAGATEEVVASKRIWRTEDREEVTTKCVEWGVLPLKDRDVTFNRIMTSLPDLFGYEVITGQWKEKDNKRIYKEIRQATVA